MEFNRKYTVFIVQDLHNQQKNLLVPFILHVQVHTTKKRSVTVQRLLQNKVRFDLNGKERKFTIVYVKSDA
jgi:hypothetical protein